jgi:AcrR family transcriptional regulator
MTKAKREMTTTKRKNPDKTRQLLLEAAYEEIHRNGYQASGLCQILERAGLTKGALYHHFADKRELGLAVLDEIIQPAIVTSWLDPLDRAIEAGADPLEALIDYLQARGQKISDAQCELGCPLNNLAQEMSGLDEDFRKRIGFTFNLWSNGLAERLASSQRTGNIRADVDIQGVARFIVASMEGSMSFAKAQHDRSVLVQNGRQLVGYLKSLKSNPKLK